MNEEEKKAIEYLKYKIAEFSVIKQRLKQKGLKTEKCDEKKIDNYKLLLNLIEKQQKELNKEKEKNKELENYKISYISKSKIEDFFKKSKIVTNESKNKTYFLIDVTEIK